MNPKETRGKIYFALGILSGRRADDNISFDEWSSLGFDPHRFPVFGTPGHDELKRQAEIIIAEAICHTLGD